MDKSYLILLKYLQELQIKLEKTEHTFSILYNFREMLEQEEIRGILSEIDIPLMVKEIENDNKYKKHKEYVNLQQQYKDLRRYLNAGNLRYVVSSLYKEEGLTIKEFSSKIQCSEQEIIDLTRDGVVTNNLLDAICQYFNVIKTSDFIRYIK